MRFPVLSAALAVLSLAGCAGHATPAAMKSLPPPVIAPHGTNRFEMTQHGQRMTADDFDAWMKARGIRVAKGTPPARAGRAPAAARTEAEARPARRGSAPKRR
ncbi:MAG: hypothetical protein ACTHOH_12360 [Lysobacteraceae bacterium]